MFDVLTLDIGLSSVLTVAMWLLFQLSVILVSKRFVPPVLAVGLTVLRAVGLVGFS